jgi:hypothetical protein
MVPDVSSYNSQLRQRLVGGAKATSGGGSGSGMNPAPAVNSAAASPKPITLIPARAKSSPTKMLMAGLALFLTVTGVAASGYLVTVKQDLRQQASVDPYLGSCVSACKGDHTCIESCYIQYREKPTTVGDSTRKQKGKQGDDEGRTLREREEKSDPSDNALEVCQALLRAGQAQYNACLISASGGVKDRGKVDGSSPRQPTVAQILYATNERDDCGAEGQQDCLSGYFSFCDLGYTRNDETGKCSVTEIYKKKPPSLFTTNISRVEPTITDGKPADCPSGQERSNGLCISVITRGSSFTTGTSCINSCNGDHTCIEHCDRVNLSQNLTQTEYSRLVLSCVHGIDYDAKRCLPAPNTTNGSMNLGGGSNCTFSSQCASTYCKSDGTCVTDTKKDKAEYEKSSDEPKSDGNPNELYRPTGPVLYTGHGADIARKNPAITKVDGACSTNYQCALGYSCYSGSCKKDTFGCKNDSECPVEYACYSGACGAKKDKVGKDLYFVGGACNGTTAQISTNGDATAMCCGGGKIECDSGVCSAAPNKVGMCSSLAAGSLSSAAPGGEFSTAFNPAEEGFCAPESEIRTATLQANKINGKVLEEGSGFTLVCDFNGDGNFGYHTVSTQVRGNVAAKACGEICTDTSIDINKKYAAKTKGPVAKGTVSDGNNGTSECAQSAITCHETTGKICIQNPMDGCFGPIEIVQKEIESHSSPTEQECRLEFGTSCSQVDGRYYSIEDMPKVDNEGKKVEQYSGSTEKECMDKTGENCTRRGDLYFADSYLYPDPVEPSLTDRVYKAGEDLWNWFTGLLPV